MKLSVFGLALILMILAAPLEAQTATVAYDAPAGVTVAQANQWSAVLYVNGTAFASAHTCVAGVAPVVTCSFVLPVITAALTTSGPQTFTVALKDAVLGEGPQSVPFIRIRPGAPINLRLQ